VDWREREANAAAVLRDCRQVLAARGSTILDEATEGLADIAAWRRFPEGEVYDPASHAQYFYHCHSAPGAPAETGSGERGEHGHFHLFLRAEGVPAGTTPLLLPELAIANAPLPRQSAPLKRGGRDEVVHLVAIAIDGRGEPIRLFTTNRWVTGETWYAAADVCAMLDRFAVDLARPSWPLNRWITAMFRLFQPEMAELLQARDAAIMSWRRRHRGKVHVFEDRRLEVTSVVEIDLEEQMRRIEQAVRRAA